MLVDGLRFDAAAVRSPQAMLEALQSPAPAPDDGGGAAGCRDGGAGRHGGGGVGRLELDLQAADADVRQAQSAAGLGRLLSKQHLGDTLKAALLAIVLGVIGGVLLAQSHGAISRCAGDAAARRAVAHGRRRCSAACCCCCWRWRCSRLVDVPLQRHLWIKRLKMSREEAKQEMKELEGNLEVKAKVKARMREMAKRRMLANVPQADLVVMNPTHYAVALKYDDATMAAPRVIAKGADLLAMRIRDLARDAKVPVLRAPPLARALYAHCEIDREVPAALFAAVAQVLAYVYQLRAALAGKAPMPQAVPEPQIPLGLDPHESQAEQRRPLNERARPSGSAHAPTRSRA